MRNALLSTPLSLCMGGVAYLMGEHWGDGPLVGFLGCVWLVGWGAVFFGDAFGPGLAVLRHRSRLRVSALSRAIHYRKGEE